VVYGIGRIDASGRIADRAVISALGWQGGDLLTLTADAGVVTARRDPGGMITLPARAYIAIPAALRRRCDLLPGDRVLLAAVPSADTLTAYSLAVVDQAIRAHGSFPHAQRSTAMTTDPVTPAATHQAAIDAALLVLKSMNLSLDNLTAHPASGRRYRPSPSTSRSYPPR
jgi:hypothetical protein